MLGPGDALFFRRSRHGRGDVLVDPRNGDEVHAFKLGEETVYVHGSPRGRRY